MYVQNEANFLSSPEITWCINMTFTVISAKAFSPQIIYVHNTLIQQRNPKFRWIEPLLSKNFE